MNFNIRHVLRYTYSRPVFCEPLTLRLRPREDAFQKLLNYRLSIDPVPAGVSEYIDLDGNTATRVWFNGLMLALTISTTLAVETRCEEPFNFLLENGATKLPIDYPPDLQPLLAPYLAPSRPVGEVDALANSVLRSAGGETVPFLALLAKRIHESCGVVSRTRGGPLPPETTLAQGGGSCRDLAVLFNEACRSVGLAARFVSGYHAPDFESDEPELHAWSEAYLPGAGWRGYDPTRGLAVADRHVALAASINSRLAAPTAGTYRGTDAISTLHTQVVMQISESHPTSNQQQSQ